MIYERGPGLLVTVVLATVSGCRCLLSMTPPCRTASLHIAVRLPCTLPCGFRAHCRTVSLDVTGSLRAPLSPGEGSIYLPYDVRRHLRPYGRNARRVGETHWTVINTVCRTKCIQPPFVRRWEVKKHCCSRRIKKHYLRIERPEQSRVLYARWVVFATAGYGMPYCTVGKGRWSGQNLPKVLLAEKGGFESSLLPSPPVKKTFKTSTDAAMPWRRG